MLLEVGSSIYHCIIILVNEVIQKTTKSYKQCVLVYVLIFLGLELNTDSARLPANKWLFSQDSIELTKLI